MIPYGDETPVRVTPFVTLALLGTNAVVYVFELTLAIAHGSDSGALESLVATWGLVPRDLLRALAEPAEAPLRVWCTPVTAMFLHAGPLHLAGNLLFLWVFGINVEDVLGHLRFLLFYLVCGLVGAALHVASLPSGYLPTIGASGAISGVLGAYLVAYPFGQVRLLVPIGFLWTTLRVPAAFFVAGWLALQLFGGLVGRADPEAAGIAWWAHLGGFATGIALLVPMRVRRPLRLGGS